MVKGQSIIVGDTTSSGIIYKNIKDSLVKMVPKTTQFSDFDYDGDSSMDIRFKVHQYYSPGYTQEFQWVVSLKSSIDFLVLTDTLFADTSALNSTIDKSLSWFLTSNEHYLHFYHYSAGNTNIGGVFKNAGSYLGFRHINGNDTIFGWFYLNVQYSTGTTVRSWAYTNKCTGVSPLSVNSSSNLICSGETSLLSATGANTYTWSTGQNGSSIVITPTITTTYTVNGTTSNGCPLNAVISQSVDACIGVEEHEIENNIYIFPNPTSGLLNILNVQRFRDGKIEIANALGQIVLRTGFKNEIDVAELPSGIYILMITFENQRYHKKFVKK